MAQRVGDGQQEAVGGRQRGGEAAGGDEAGDHIRKAGDLRRGEHDHVGVDDEVLQSDDAGVTGDRLAGGDDGIDAGGILAADLDQPQLAPCEQPRPDGREVPADDVGIDLELGERGIGRCREVQQEDEQQRPRHRLARLTHARRGEIAHQDVRQRGGADHHAEDDREEVQRAVVDEGLDVRFERCQRRQPGLHHLLLARRYFCDGAAIGQLGDRNAVMLRRQDHDGRQIGNDQHDILRDLRPSHGPHAAQHRAQQDAGQAGEYREFERHAEEARRDQARTVDLRRHVGERAADEHDDRDEAREVSAEAERHEVGHGIGAEFAQIRADQDRHQHEAAGPAQHPGEAVIAEQEQRAGHADEGRCRHPIGAGRHPVVERRHAPAGNVVFGNLRRARHHPDDGVNRNRETHEQITQNLVRDPGLLEDREQNDETDEAPGIGAIHLPEVFDEIGRAGCLSSHDRHLPQSSSATPNSRSILSCCFANMNSWTTNTMSEPCAAM